MAATSSPPPPRTEVAPGVWLDARLGLFFSAHRLLVVADLHWGYVESHRSRGNLLPWWGDDEIEQRLLSLIADYTPDEMLWLGDSLHALSGRTRAEQFIRSLPLPVTILSGNHDARWHAAKDRRLIRGGYYFHHGDQPAADLPDDAFEVVGHHHPAVSFADGAGTRLKLPALIVGPRRMILPAFSPWAAGTPWPRSQPDETLWVVSPRRIFRLPASPSAAPPSP